MEMTRVSDAYICMKFIDLTYTASILNTASTMPNKTVNMNISPSQALNLYLHININELYIQILILFKYFCDKLFYN